MMMAVDLYRTPVIHLQSSSRRGKVIKKTLYKEEMPNGDRRNKSKINVGRGAEPDLVDGKVG